MNIRLLRNDADLQQALTRLDALWGAEFGTAEGDELGLLALVIERYEDEYCPMPPFHPIAAIQFRMEQQGLSAKDLEPLIGSSGRVSEVLNGKRRLSLRMIRNLHNTLHIPYEKLMTAV